MFPSNSSSIPPQTSSSSQSQTVDSDDPPPNYESLDYSPDEPPTYDEHSLYPSYPCPREARARRYFTFSGDSNEQEVEASATTSTLSILSAAEIQASTIYQQIKVLVETGHGQEFGRFGYGICAGNHGIQGTGLLPVLYTNPAVLANQKLRFVQQVMSVVGITRMSNSPYAGTGIILVNSENDA